MQVHDEVKSDSSGDCLSVLSFWIVWGMWDYDDGRLVQWLLLDMVKSELMTSGASEWGECKMIDRVLLWPVALPWHTFTFTITLLDIYLYRYLICMLAPLHACTLACLHPCTLACLPLPSHLLLFTLLLPSPVLTLHWCAGSELDIWYKLAPLPSSQFKSILLLMEQKQIRGDQRH